MGKSLNAFYLQNEHWILPVTSLMVFLSLWETVARLEIVNPLLISSPSRMVVAARWLLDHGLLEDFRVSSLEFTLGYGMGVIIGIPAGIVLGWYRRAKLIFDPFISALYATPRVALMPLLLLWLGLGVESKIAVVFLGAVFPILVNVLSGMRTLDPQLLRCAYCFGAKDHQIFLTLAFPSTIPFMIAGMRLAIGRALVGVVVGELIGSNAGIGHMMSIAGATFQTDKVFVGIIILSMTGYILTEVLKKIESYFEVWRPNSSPMSKGV